MPLPGSERAPIAEAEVIGPVDPWQRIDITLVTRRRAELPADLVTGPSVLSRDELAARHGTDPADAGLLCRVLGRHRIEVTDADTGPRRIRPGQDPSGADLEILLGIEVAGGAAPGAHQVVYFAPNTDRGFVDAVTTVVHASPTPAVVSISWGASEDPWTAQARGALDQAIADAAALGVTAGTTARTRPDQGWDPCTGLGSPDGAALLAMLACTQPGPAASAGSAGPPA